MSRRAVFALVVAATVLAAVALRRGLDRIAATSRSLEAARASAAARREREDRVTFPTELVARGAVARAATLAAAFDGEGKGQERGVLVESGPFAGDFWFSFARESSGRTLCLVGARGWRDGAACSVRACAEIAVVGTTARIMELSLELDRP